MFNLLPVSEKKRMRSEYIWRFVAVFLSFTLATSILAFVFLFPSYIVSSLKNSEVTAKADQLRKSISFNENENFSALLKDAREKIRLLSPDGNLMVNEHLRVVVESLPKGVRLNSFLYKKGTTEDENALQIFITGRADHRDNLLEYKESLDNVSEFSKVDLPFSNLISETNLNFNIDMDIKKNE